MQSVDVPGMLQDTEELSRKTTKLQFKRYSKLKVGNMLRRHFNEDRAPRGLTFKKFLQTLQGLTDKKLGRDGMDKTFSYRVLLVAGMPFQDAYNYDIERLRRLCNPLRRTRPEAESLLHLQLGAWYREKIERLVLVSVRPEDAAACRDSGVSVHRRHRGFTFST